MLSEGSCVSDTELASRCCGRGVNQMSDSDRSVHCSMCMDCWLRASSSKEGQI